MPDPKIKIDMKRAIEMASDMTPEEQKRAQKKEDIAQAKLKKMAEIRQFVAQSTLQNTAPEFEELGNFIRVPFTNNDVLVKLNEWTKKGYKFLMSIIVPMGAYNYLILEKEKEKK